MKITNMLENTSLLAGRFLLGAYFILPAILKITGFDATASYMAVHNVPLIVPLLILAIIIQLGCGTGLIMGIKGKQCAFILAGLTLVISIYMHNFWGYSDGIERNHETQNFIKNMGIMAGLLIVAGLGTGPFSVDNYLKTTTKT